jgi:hypothetical protein
MHFRNLVLGFLELFHLISELDDLKLVHIFVDVIVKGVLIDKLRLIIIIFVTNHELLSGPWPLSDIFSHIQNNVILRS